MPSAAVDDDSVRLLLEKVAADTTLSTSERNAAKRMRSSADRPELVLERIQRRAMEFLPRLPRALPQNDLARVVQAATFLRHHSKPFVNQAFNTADDFATAVGKSLDGSLLLHDCLSDNEPLTSWTRSWLTESRAIRSLGGIDLSQGLELNKRPPFVVFIFSAANCKTYDIRVRTPCSLDSGLGPNLQWSPRGLKSGMPEFVDGPIPRAAVSSLVG